MTGFFFVFMEWIAGYLFPTALYACAKLTGHNPDVTGWRDCMRGWELGFFAGVGTLAFILLVVGGLWLLYRLLQRQRNKA